MFIDTHCHLNFQAFDKDLSDIVRHAKESGVGQIVIPGAHLDSSQKAIEVAAQFLNCFAAIGIHPHHAKDADVVVNDDLKNKLTTLIKQPKVVAVGEIGMDYFVYQKSKYPETELSPELKDKQRALFELQLTLAHEHNLPVIFHCRQAYGDIWTIIDEFITKTKWQARGVFHCFGGGKKDLHRALDRGFYISIDGNITYNPNLQFVAAEVPIEKLLLETDAPYLTPVPHRQERNEPKYIPLIAENIAKVKDISVDEIADRTTHNAQLLFNLPV